AEDLGEHAETDQTAGIGLERAFPRPAERLCKAAEIIAQATGERHGAEAVEFLAQALALRSGDQTLVLETPEDHGATGAEVVLCAHDFDRGKARRTRSRPAPQLATCIQKPQQRLPGHEEHGSELVRPQ